MRHWQENFETKKRSEILNFISKYSTYFILNTKRLEVINPQEIDIKGISMLNRYIIKRYESVFLFIQLQNKMFRM